MNYRNEWLKACFGNAGRTITVYFKGDREPATYPESSFHLLKQEKIVECITSDETGEILYSA